MIVKLVKSKVVIAFVLVLCGMALGVGVSGVFSDSVQVQSELLRTQDKLAKSESDAKRDIARAERLAREVQKERNDLLGALNDVCRDFQNSMFGLSAMLGDAKGPLWESWHNTGVEHCSYQGFPIE